MSGISPMFRLLPRVYWANRRRFLYPGLIVWAFGRHWRILPIRRKP